MKTVIIFVIKWYQMLISPLFPPACRFYPTCSEYMIDAVRVKGVIKGVLCGFKRILKCHPFHKGGVDFVEDHNG